MPKAKQDRSMLALRLRYLRTVADLTQTQLASLLGIRRDTYANYEVGRSCPSTPLRYRLAAIYSVSPDVLLNPEATPLSTPEQRLHDATYMPVRGLTSLPEDEKTLVGYFRLLTVTEKEQLLQQLSEMLKSH